MCSEIQILCNGSDKWPNEKIDTVIRWGCTATIEPEYKNVINPAKAIHKVADKAGFRKLVQDKYENIVPRTWFDIDSYLYDEPDNISVVIRPKQHSQGRELYYVHSIYDLNTVCNRLNDYYISEYIEKVAEYRVFVVQGRVACVANKIPENPHDIAWNVYQGGKFENVRWNNWPIEAIKSSLLASHCTGLDFGGVDVMVDAEGRAFVLEINSAPSLTSPYRQQCMAKCFDWIIEHGKERMELDNNRRGYGRYIHPAVEI